MPRKSGPRKFGVSPVSDWAMASTGPVMVATFGNLYFGKTQLVVLSACETSLGYLDAGEGVYGLQRAFRAAGAASIITSLWKVDDTATKDFMIFFYRHYLQTKDKSAAFSTAQKTVREKYVHPYYWGAFVMTGQ